MATLFARSLSRTPRGHLLVAENAKQCRETRNTNESRTVRAGISRKDSNLIPNCSEYLPDPTKVASTGSRHSGRRLPGCQRAMRPSKMTLCKPEGGISLRRVWTRGPFVSDAAAIKTIAPQAQRFCGSSRRASSGWAGRRTGAMLLMKFFSTRLLSDCSDRLCCL